MKLVYGTWLPDHEKHLVGQLRNGAGHYQMLKQMQCYNVLNKRGSQYRTAIDVGAHVGLWTKMMAMKFKQVEAFEPVKEHIECFKQNIAACNVYLHQCALGDHEGELVLTTELGSSGNTHVKGHGGLVNGALSCVVQPLDNLSFKDVDFIKIDCEGYEYFVLRGGKETIKQYKPVIIIEQKHNYASSRYGVADKAAVSLLEGWGAKLQFELSGDYCLAW